MKKKQIIFCIAIVAVVVLLVLLAVFLLPNLMEKQGPKPEETLKAVMEAVTETGSSKPLIVGADGTPVAVTAPQGIAAVICQQMRYEILETQTEGDRCVATMKIRVPDAVALVQRALKDMGSYEEAAFLDRMTALLEETAPMREATVEVELTRIEENWYLVSNGEFSDAITGGMLSRRLELEALIREALAGGATE